MEDEEKRDKLVRRQQGEGQAALEKDLPGECGDEWSMMKDVP